MDYTILAKVLLFMKVILIDAAAQSLIQQYVLQTDCEIFTIFNYDKKK